MAHAALLRPRTLMWLPALLLVGIAVLAASGFRLVGPSYAASTGSAVVSATVTPELHIGGTCPGANLVGPAMAVADATTVLGSCTLTFGTNNNNPGGSLIRVETPRATAGDETFCTTAVTLACGANSFTDVATAGVAFAAVPEGGFGVNVNGAPTCNTATWTNGNVYGLEDATTAAGTGNLICDHNTFPGDASYNLRFVANPTGSTVAGTYQGRADFTVEAS